MQSPTRYVVAVLVGLVAGTLSYLVAAPTVGTTRVWFVTVLTALVWSVGATLYLTVLARVRRIDAGAGSNDPNVAAKWGGMAGGVVGIGIGGTSVLLVELVAGRYVAAVALFVFGFCLGCMSVGMGVVADRFSDSVTGPTAANPKSDGAAAAND